MMQDFLFYKILVPIIEYGISFRINQAAFRYGCADEPCGPGNQVHPHL